MNIETEIWEKRLAAITGDEDALTRFSQEVRALVKNTWVQGSTVEIAGPCITLRKLANVADYLHDELKAIRIIENPMSSKDELRWAQDVISEHKAQTLKDASAMPTSNIGL